MKFIDNWKKAKANNINVPKIDKTLDKLVWMLNGRRKNISYDSEPSAVDITMNIDTTKKEVPVLPPKIGTAYVRLTPEQKWEYISFLSKPYSGKYDMGYVFLLYFGLERFLMDRTEFRLAFDAVCKLREVYDDKKFNIASANAIICSCINSNEPKYLGRFFNELQDDKIELIEPELYFFSKVSLGLPVTSVDLYVFQNYFDESIDESADDDSIKKYTREEIDRLLQEKNGESIISTVNMISQEESNKLNRIEFSCYMNPSICDITCDVPNLLQKESLLYTKIKELLY